MSYTQSWSKAFVAYNRTTDTLVIIEPYFSLDEWEKRYVERPDHDVTGRFVFQQITDNINHWIKICDF